MARPTTKSDLIDAATQSFDDLYTLVYSIPADKREELFPFEDRDKKISDVLMHLHEWHKMLLKWYEVGMRGGKPDMPAPGYSWRELPALNQQIWSSVQNVSLDEAEQLLKESHEEVLALVHQHSEEEIFTKKYYKWTKTSHLASYFISNLSSHYNWAIKKIKKYKRSLS